MKRLSYFFIFIALSACLHAQDLQTMALNLPDKSRGLPVMQALEKRASSWEFSDKKLNLQDLSDLLWAADGINRPEIKKRTAPSAQNAQDIDIYVFMEEGIYIYNASGNALNPVKKGDFRSLIEKVEPYKGNAPVILLLVSDISRFRAGGDSIRLSWAAMDAGIVSQNIALFCASAGLNTRPRSSMDHAGLREILKLKDTQYIMLNNPVSYPPVKAD